MVYKLMFIPIFMVVVMGSIYLSSKIMKRYKINRWIVAVSAPLVIIIPSILIKQINGFLWNILIVIFSFLCILFFQLTQAKYDEIKEKSKRNNAMFYKRSNK